MLQQTQVERVVPKWFDFLERWPTPARCAAAPLGDVLSQWQGLGYPRRAKNLHAAAVEIVRLGDFPRLLGGLLELPGVGPYTARAVLAFAFERDVAIVDTNVARVLARVANRRLTAQQAQAAADALVPSGEGWFWNQAMLDVGARLCRPRAAKCTECPLRVFCVWHGGGNAAPDPAIGSAGVSVAQARFEGSDRQARGRLMKRLTSGAIASADAARIMGRTGDAMRARRVVATLVADGLVVERDDRLSLP